MYNAASRKYEVKTLLLKNSTDSLNLTFIIQFDIIFYIELPFSNISNLVLHVATTKCRNLVASKCHIYECNCNGLSRNDDVKLTCAGMNLDRNITCTSNYIVLKFRHPFDAHQNHFYK